MMERVVVIHNANVPEINKIVAMAFQNNNRRLSLGQLAQMEAAERLLRISIVPRDKSVDYNKPGNRIYLVRGDGFIYEENPL